MMSEHQRNKLEMLYIEGLQHLSAGHRQQAFGCLERITGERNIPADIRNSTLETIVDQFILVKRGRCNSCEGSSTCCRNVFLRLGSDFINTQEQYEIFCSMNPSNSNWEHTGNTNGHWLFTCRQLSSDGKCMDYNRRSATCREFPVSFRHIQEIPLCSYRFKLHRQIPTFTSASALQAVVAYLSEYGLQIIAKKLEELQTNRS